jgi:hypothetical protein
MVKKNHKKKICLHGGNHSSKRRSESESHNQYNRIKSKTDIKGENEDIEVKNKGTLRTPLKTAKAKVTAKADEVKALGKTLKEFRVEKEKQVDTKIEAESPVTLPPHFATTFKISILTFTIFIFTFNFFISIFNPFVSDPLDHHFQTVTIGDLSDCKVPCLSRQTISAQTKNTVNALANPDSIRLFKVPETQPDPRSGNLPRNLLVPKHLLSGQVRKSENDLYSDSFLLNYLDSYR